MSRRSLMSVAASGSLTNLVERNNDYRQSRLGRPPVVRGQIVEWRRQGLSWNAIVKKLGVSKGVVVCACHEVVNLTGNRIKVADAVA